MAEPSRTKFVTSIDTPAAVVGRSGHASLRAASATLCVGGAALGASLSHKCYARAMKALSLLVAGVATAVAMASTAEAQQRSMGGAPRGPTLANHAGMHAGMHGGMHGGLHGGQGVFIPYYVEREPVIIEREVVREVPVVVEPPPPPPPPREPYVIGKSYASLPGGCMKMIEDAASYYLCSGEWYRQVGSGSAARYKAIVQP